MVWHMTDRHIYLIRITESGPSLGAMPAGASQPKAMRRAGQGQAAIGAEAEPVKTVV